MFVLAHCVVVQAGNVLSPGIITLQKYIMLGQKGVACPKELRRSSIDPC